MLTIEQIKEKLNSADVEGADKAGIYDEILSDIADTYNKISEFETGKAEADKRITELSDKANELTQTNLKLLDKIKYVNEEAGKQEPEIDDEPEVEIADLTTWYDTKEE